MSRPILCDICERKMDPADPRNLNRPSGEFDVEVRHVERRGITGNDDSDICPECKKRILDFISEMHLQSPYVEYHHKQAPKEDPIVWHKGYTTGGDSDVYQSV